MTPDTVLVIVGIAIGVCATLLIVLCAAAIWLSHAKAHAKFWGEWP